MSPDATVTPRGSASETPALETPAFDTIVVGLGAMGAATLLQLARRGQRVLGLDRFHPPHDQGSTHGETRITRCAIGEGEIYVPLALRSHEIWRELEAETGMDLLTQCGALIVSGSAVTAPLHGKPDFLGSTIAAARRYGLAHELMDAETVMRRFPQLRLRPDETAYFEQGGGFVRPERCIEAQLQLARRHGAAIRTGTEVTSIVRDGAGVAVTTAAGDRFRAAELVLAAGAWSPGFAGALAPRMQVLRQVLHWFAPDRPADYAPDRFPVFIWVHGATADDSFYGFPMLPGGEGLKLACEQYATPSPHPGAVDRQVSPAEAEAMVRHHVAPRMVGVGRHLAARTCLYTMTAQGDFLIRRLPQNDRVLLLSACSGHGFKHSAALGEAVAESLVDPAHASRLAPFAA